MEIIECIAPLPSEQDITNFELRYEFRLPHSYRKFLLEYNGGDPDDANVFNFADDSGETSSDVRRFLFLGEGEDSLDAWLTAYKGRLPANVLPIAYDQGGNPICLILGGEDAPVAFWDHEQESNDNNLTEFYAIAPDFETFCSDLHAL